MPPEPVTMVFTDLVDSTAMKGRLAGADPAARDRAFVDTVLAPHRARVEAGLARHGGRAVKTLGDSYFLVFSDPVQAARWAVEVQLSHAREPIVTPLGPLQVRVGIHVGSPLPSGGDFIGREVDYAARVAALATGGQIALSEAMAGRLRRAAAGEWTLHDHGERNLKGIGRAAVFELLYGGRSAQPLRDPPRSPTNLPPPPDALIGRDNLAAELMACLAAGCLSILKGEGGIGKTALALWVAHRLRDAGALPGGAAWIDCGVRPSRDEALRQLAGVFFESRLEEVSPAECERRVLAHLRDRSALAVFDNFESVADNGDLVRFLAGLRPPAKALVTTRDLPPGLTGHVIEVQELSRKEAVGLFRHRARSAGMAVEGHEAAIDALCQSVGDLPLAIELLAARRMPLGRLAERLGRDLGVVDARGDFTRPARHQSVRACIRLSFEALSAAARELLLTLSVLPAGARPAVITAVLGRDDWDEAAESLVAGSVWRLAGERYGVHPLIRQFALEALGADRAETERRVARAVGALAAETGRQTRPGAVAPPAMAAALDWIEAEWRNLVAAGEYAFAAEDWPTVGALAEAVRHFFLIRGHWQDCERLFEHALAARRATADRAGEGVMLNCLGAIYLNQGRRAEAEERFRRSLAIRRDLGQPAPLATTLNNLGILFSAEKRFDEARSAFAEALGIWRDLGDRLGEATTLNSLANIHYTRGEWPEAERACRAALAVWREVGDQLGAGKTLNNLASVLAAEERWAEAEEACRESLALRRELGDRLGEGGALQTQAQLLEAQGNLSGAIDAAREAVRVLMTTEDAQSSADARAYLAQLEQKVVGAGPRCAS